MSPEVQKRVIDLAFAKAKLAREPKITKRGPLREGMVVELIAVLEDDVGGDGDATVAVVVRNQDSSISSKELEFHPLLSIPETFRTEVFDPSVLFSGDPADLYLALTRVVIEEGELEFEDAGGGEVSICLRFRNWTGEITVSAEKDGRVIPQLFNIS